MFQSLSRDSEGSSIEFGSAKWAERGGFNLLVGGFDQSFDWIRLNGISAEPVILSIGQNGTSRFTGSVFSDPVRNRSSFSDAQAEPVNHWCRFEGLVKGLLRG